MLGDLQLEGPFEQVAGRFNFDRRTDVFLAGGLKTRELVTAVNPENGKLEMALDWMGTNVIVHKAAPARPDHWYAGDFNGDGKDDIFIHTPYQAELLIANGTALTRTWISSGGTTPHDMIDTWQLGPFDRVVVGDYDGDGGSELFLRSDLSSGLFKTDGQSLWLDQKLDNRD